MSSSTRGGYRYALRDLSRAQKSNRGAGGYSRWVNRPLGRRIAAGAYAAGLTPNQISLVSALFSYAAIAVIALVRPSWPMSVLVALALVLGYAFDSADGQVARLRGGGSVAGEWLDHVIDALKICALHAAILVSWARFYDVGRATLLVPIGFAVVAAVFYFAITLSDMLRRVVDARTGGAGKSTATRDLSEAAPVLRSIIVLPNDYGVLAVALVLLPAHTAFVWVYGVLLAANTVFLVVGCVRWFREMRALDATMTPR